MSYTIGVSSGAAGLVEASEKQSLITIPKKIFAGGLEGVTFTQVDLESITEFNAPNVDKDVKKIKDLGIKFGFHGEFYGGAERPLEMLDSAVQADYIHSHQRLIDHIKGCGRLGGEYVVFHPSQTEPFIKLSNHLQPTVMVDPFGRPFSKLLKSDNELFEWAISQDFISSILLHRGNSLTLEQYMSSLERHYKENNKDVKREDIEKEAREAFKQTLENFVSTSDLAYGSERVAYYIVAKWMQKNNDPIWKQIVGMSIADKDLPDKYKCWVPAVSAKYIWGHFNPQGKGLEDPKPLLDKHNLMICFESEMGRGGTEGMSRFYKPTHMIALCKSIKSSHVAICVDFEHILSQNVDVPKEIAAIPFGDAKFVRLVHLGFPTPIVPAHLPIPMGSTEQLWIYERLFEMRKKGFKEGWMIFERGSAPRESVILVLRNIKEFLEKDIPPKLLPLEFYGMKEDGPEVTRQKIAIKEHTIDPLKGMLLIPEEDYTFIGSEAVRKGKGEEWRKEKLK